MTWQTPAAFWLLLAIPLLVAIFLYRRKFPVVVVPSLGPWSVIGTPIRSTSWRNLLRRIMVLLLELAIVGALILAAAGPRRAAGDVASTIVVLDLSATMLTRTSDGGTRFDLARQLVRERISSVGESSVSMIFAGDVPRLQQATQTGPLAAIDAARPLHLDSDLGESLKLASTIAGDREDVVVEVYSDFAGQRPDILLRTWNSKAKLSLRQVGEDAADVGVLHASYDPNGKSIRGTLAQHGMTGQSISLTAHTKTTQIGGTSVSLDDSSTEFALPVVAQPEENSVIELRIEGEDALPLNNRFLLRSAAPQRTVALISRSPAGLAPIISSAENVTLVEVGTISEAGDADLIVVDRRDIAAGAMPDRSFLFVGCVDPFGWLSSKGRIPCSAPTSWAPEHPLLKDIFPDVLQTSSAIEVSVGESAEAWSIVESGSVPLMMEARSREGNTAVYLLFDPFSSSAGSSLAPMLLILNAIDYLAPSGTSDRPYLVTGESAQLPPMETSPIVMSPEGDPVSATISGGGWRISQLAIAGEYAVQAGDRAFSLPVNYCSTRSASALPEVPRPTEDDRIDYLAWIGSLPPAALIAAAALALLLTETTLASIGRLRV